MGPGLCTRRRARFLKERDQSECPLGPEPSDALPTFARIPQ
jgi:hypothetical protein